METCSHMCRKVGVESAGFSMVARLCVLERGLGQMVFFSTIVFRDTHYKHTGSGGYTVAVNTCFQGFCVGGIFGSWFIEYV